VSSALACYSAHRVSLFVGLLLLCQGTGVQVVDYDCLLFLIVNRVFVGLPCSFIIHYLYILFIIHALAALFLCLALTLNFFIIYTIHVQFLNFQTMKNWDFEPAALNTFGGMGPRMRKILGLITEAVAVKFDSVPEVYLRM